MKKIIIALAAMSFSLASQAYTVNLNELTDFGNQMRDRYGPSVEERKTDSMYCVLHLTVERTNKKQVRRIKLDGEYTKQGTLRTYHEEDATGSTTIQVDEKTRKGIVSIMDESSVIVSGTATC